MIKKDKLSKGRNLSKSRYILSMIIFSLTVYSSIPPGIFFFFMLFYYIVDNDDELTTYRIYSNDQGNLLDTCLYNILFFSVMTFISGHFLCFQQMFFWYSEKYTFYKK